jgi:MFS family permease
VSTLPLLRNRDFAAFWGARTTMVLATQMQATAMAWQAYDVARQTMSVAEAAFVLGLLGLAQFLPVLILSLVGGQAADRLNRKAILIAAFLFKLALSGLLIAATQTGGQAVLIAVFTVATLTGVIQAFQPPASQALFPTLMPREDLPRAIAMMSLGVQGASIAGPALGGIAVAAAGPVPTYAATACLLVLATGMLLFVRAPRHERVDGQDALALIREGLVFVRNSPILFGAISLDLAVVLLAGAVALFPVFARDIIQAGPEALGLLRAAPAIGAAIVAALLAARPIRTAVGRWMFGATIVFGLATIVFGLSTALWLSVAAMIVAGAADMISVYVRSSLVQLATPDAMRGRVAAVSSVFISASNELGDFQSGVAARLVGPVLAVTMGGAGAIGVVGLWVRWFPALWRADRFDDARSS